MDGISRSRGWDKEIPHGVLPMEQLVLSDKWARKQYPLGFFKKSVGIKSKFELLTFNTTLVIKHYVPNKQLSEQQARRSSPS